MTIRVAMLIFLATFAAITGWLVLRSKPADIVVTQSPPVPTSSQDRSKEQTKTAEKEETSRDEVVAISDAERAIRDHLNQVVIPSIDFENISIEEAMDFLRLRTREIEPTGESTLRGISFVVRKPAISSHGDEGLDAEPSPPDQGRLISVQAENITMSKALDLICEKGGYRWSLEDHHIILTPIS